MMKHPTLQQVFAPIISLAAAFAAAALGAIAVNRSLRSWYVQIEKPAWNPPDWVFGPVWTFLYITMAISAWLVWRDRTVNPAASNRALAWFALQLVLNAAWSWFFFAWRRPDWAFIEIIVLWLAILMTIVASWRINRGAACLLLPYLLWVTFAAALNGAIWFLNSR